MRAGSLLLAVVAAVAATGCDRPPPGVAAVPGNTREARLPGAFATRCAALPLAPPEASADPILPQFDETRSLADLTAMYERAAAHHQTLGLTHARLAYLTRLAANGLQDGDRACMRVKVRVQVTMESATVFIAREIAADPCRRGAVRDHEMRHVEAHAAFLREAPDRLLALLDAADVGRVRHGADPEAIQQEAMREVSDIVTRAEATDRAGLAAMQAAIDTPDEYARATRSCDAAVVAVPADGLRGPADRR